MRRWSRSSAGPPPSSTRRRASTPPDGWTRTNTPKPPRRCSRRRSARCSATAWCGCATCPTTPGSLDAIARRIGPPRPTNFGTLFDVRASPIPDSNAYTSIALPPHVDLPTREYQPGLQLLHCLEESIVEGGQAVMMDGFAVAEALRERSPEAFATLTRVKWCYANTARTSDYVWFNPMIQCDAEGRLSEVRIADFLRGPLMAPFDEVEPAYEALMELQRLLREPRFAMRFNYRPGDLVIFDNRRLLHARDAFEGTSGQRWLQGCYLERDEVRSRWRMLKRAARQRRVEALGQHVPSSDPASCVTHQADRTVSPVSSSRARRSG